VSGSRKVGNKFVWLFCTKSIWKTSSIVLRLGLEYGILEDKETLPFYGDVGENSLRFHKSSVEESGQGRGIDLEVSMLYKTRLFHQNSQP
jgi:hypothetical protein